MADITLWVEIGKEQAVMKNLEVYNGSGVEKTMRNQSILGDDQARRTSGRNRRLPVRYDSFFEEERRDFTIAKQRSLNKLIRQKRILLTNY
ncbi:hypothetical protein GJ496_009885 [Pomphorhynchus laevis]|nr:hypothetical protein GJ496_009885 [Pomphorhynchus laevis]